MKTFLTLFGREVKSFFYSPIAYVVLFYFLLLSGVNFWYQISVINGYPVELTLVEIVFAQALFWFPFILSFPLITMKVYSEEYRMGTLETLTTAPVRDWQIVLSKFAGVVFFYCILWAPNFLSFAAFEQITHHAAANSAGAYYTTFLLLFLMGLFFCSVGCFASALTQDQIIAATISFSIILICVFLPFLPMVMNNNNPVVRDIFSYFSPTGHMDDFSKGIIDSRPLVWYLSMTALMTYLTLQVFQFRKWKA
jgi:ABC-2 type transport system permease protein